MFHYEVMSEQQAQHERFQLLEPGTYTAVVMKAEEKVSLNTGNPMLDITLKVWGSNGKTATVRDFLVFSPAMMWKVIDFCKSANIMEQYMNQELCAELILNKNVFVKIGIEEGKEIPMDKLKGKMYGSRYPDKNKVETYVTESIAGSLTNASDNPALVNNMPFDDDVIF